MSWYPIETAPKDGSCVLCYCPAVEIESYICEWTKPAHWEVLYWEKAENTWTDGEYNHDPVMWQPLTTPEEYCGN